MATWLVRAGSNGEDEVACLESGLAIIGFRDVPGLQGSKSKEDIQAAVAKSCPGDSVPRIRNFTAQLTSFVHLMQPGDIVALPRKRSGKIALGQVEGDYAFQLVDGEMRHVRPVTWLRPDVPRSEFGQDLLYSLGAFLTTCRIKRNDADTRLKRILKGHPDPGIATAEPSLAIEADLALEPDVQVNFESLASDHIREHIEVNFKGHELTRLINEILNAEGYFTYMSPPGPDGGVDILGRKGTLGLDGQQLCVQVKSSSSPCDVTVFRGLQGSMQTFNADRGLLVCWGGFNKVVMAESRTHFFNIRLWDSQDIIEALFRNYDELPEGLRAEIPLKRVWTMVLDA